MRVGRSAIHRLRSSQANAKSCRLGRAKRAANQYKPRSSGAKRSIIQTTIEAQTISLAPSGGGKSVVVGSRFGFPKADVIKTNTTNRAKKAGDSISWASRSISGIRDPTSVLPIRPVRPVRVRVLCSAGVKTPGPIQASHIERTAAPAMIAPAAIATTPVAFASLSPLESNFSMAMTMATATITARFIAPSTS